MLRAQFGVGVTSFDGTLARTSRDGVDQGDGDGDDDASRAKALRRLGVSGMMVSNSGVSLGMIFCHDHGLSSPVGEGNPEDVVTVGVYLRTISVHRWKTVSEICNFQSTAFKNVNSFSLISWVSNPEILLHARAE